MARPPLPTVGADADTWGEKLNDVLEDLQDSADIAENAVPSTALLEALPSGIGSNNQVLKVVGGAPAWAADTNTTYTEISEAEITTGTASTARTISGRRAQFIADKAVSSITGSINFELHGGDDGIQAADVAMVRMNFAGTITGWDVYSTVSGSIVATVGKATHAAFPTFAAISGTAKPTLASAAKNQTSTLTGWTTGFVAGDVIRVSVDSATTVTDVVISLRYTRTA